MIHHKHLSVQNFGFYRNSQHNEVKRQELGWIKSGCHGCAFDPRNVNFQDLNLNALRRSVSDESTTTNLTTPWWSVDLCLVIFYHKLLTVAILIAVLKFLHYIESTILDPGWVLQFHDRVPQWVNLVHPLRVILNDILTNMGHALTTMGDEKNKAY